MDNSSAPQNNETVKKWQLLAISLLDKIKAQEIDPLTLTDDQRRICVRFLMHQYEVPNYQVAELLGVNRTTIWRDKQKIRNDDMLISIMIDEVEMAQDLRDAAEHSAAKLEAQKRFKDAWTVRRECVEILQNMGFCKKAATEIQLSGDFISFLNNFSKAKNGGHAVEKDSNGQRASRLPGQSLPDLGAVLPRPS